MEQQVIATTQNDAYKVYTAGQILVAAIVGGPLAAGFMLGNNYRTIGRQQAAIVIWAISLCLVASVIGLFVLFDFWQSNDPTRFTSAETGKKMLLFVEGVYPLLMYFFAFDFRERNLIEDTDAIFPWWRLLWIIPLGFILNIMIFGLFRNFIF